MKNLRTAKAMNALEIKEMFPMLRKHQVDALELAFRQRDSNAGKYTLIEVTPGGGKSALPSIFTHILREKYPNLKMMWIVPRKSLQEQGVDSVNQSDKYSMKDILNTNLRIQVGSNEVGSGLGADGYVITYQSVNRGITYHIDSMNETEYVLFLDECHHIKENISLGNSEDDAEDDVIAQLINHKNCKFIYQMTGTAERHDQEKLAFLPYKGNEVDLNHKDWNYIKYTRSDALKEEAKLELTFVILDAQGEYINKKGDKVIFETLKEKEDNLSSNYKLRTILLTNFSEMLIDKSIEELTRQRRENKYAQLIILASNQALAKSYLKYIEANTDYKPLLAISHEKNSQNAIRNFRFGHASILVTVGMAHEGLDAPGVSIVAVLTNYRSKPWMEQAFDRATRINYKIDSQVLQTATIFAPADNAMSEIIEMISKEQKVKPNIKEEILANKKRGASKRGENFFEAVQSEAIETIISSEKSEITVDEFEAIWIQEKFKVPRSNVLFLKKSLLNAGMYDYPTRKITMYTKKDIQNIIKLYGNKIKGELMSAARFAAIRCGSNKFDADAHFQKLEEAFIHYGVDSHKLKISDFDKIKAFLNQECLSKISA